MRNLMIAAVAALGLVATTNAAHANGGDCFDKGTGSYVPCYGWEGWYAGVHAGYQWSEIEIINPAAVAVLGGELETDGALAGGHFGYNGIYGDLMVGFEIDASILFGDEEDVSGGGSSLEGDFDYLSSARLRVGLPQGEYMPYVTAGAALVGWEARGTGVIAGGDEQSELGVVAGAGVEMFVDSNIILGVEGLYYFASQDADFGLGVETLEIEDLISARARLSYKF